MKLKAIKCPNCDGSLEIEDELDTFFCQYCGYNVILDEQSDSAIQAKVKMKQMEHEKNMQEKEHQQERYILERKINHSNIIKKRRVIILISCVLLYIISMVVVFSKEKRESDIQEKELQGIVNEVMIDIKDGDFDEAYVKANSIQYTEDWSDNIKKKWDNTREELIRQIEEAEDEATDEGWLDWLD